MSKHKILMPESLMKYKNTKGVRVKIHKVLIPWHTKLICFFTGKKPYSKKAIVSFFKPTKKC